MQNLKISAGCSLADICFLHVLIRLIRCILVSVPWYFSGVKYFAYGYISVFFIRVCKRLQATVSFCFILCFHPFQTIGLLDNIYIFCFYSIVRGVRPLECFLLEVV